MSKLTLKEALTMAAVFGAGASEHFSLSRRPRMTSHPQDEKHYTPVPKHIDRSVREFSVHGEKIMAHNKKTALKIYERIHKK